jgi:hypothetical protein
MKIERSVLTATFLATGCVALAAGVASAQTTGTITQNGVAMPVKSALAVLAKDNVTVSLFLLPFTPTRDEVTMLRQKKTEKLLSRPSGDARWPKHTPYVELELTWGHNPSKVGALDQAFFPKLHGYGITDEQFIVDIPGSGKASLEGPVKDGARLTATASGSDADKKAAWDFKAVAPVVTVLP